MQVLLIELSKCASIFALAFFAFWPAIPAGLALGLSPVIVIAITTLSYSFGVAAIALLGNRIRRWTMHRFQQSAAAPINGRLHRIWERYGLVGLGVAAPMTVGAQIGAVFGIVLNASPRRLCLAMSFGALAWSIALTTACLVGLMGIRAVITF